MTIAVDLGRKATKQTNKQYKTSDFHVLYATETWPLTKPKPSVFLYSIRSMIRHLLNIKFKLKLTSSEEAVWPLGYKPFFILNSAEHEIILLINVKMPTIGILTFISMIKTTSERLTARQFFICRYFSFYEQWKFHAQLSRKKVL